MVRSSRPAWVMGHLVSKNKTNEKLTPNLKKKKVNNSGSSLPQTVTQSRKGQVNDEEN